MAELKVADKAPSFSLEDQNGKTVSLADFKGRKLLLYFYPTAATLCSASSVAASRTLQACLVQPGVSAFG